jgi:hypothetical protein
VSAGALAADIRARGMKAAVSLAVSTGVDAVMPLLQAAAVDMVRPSYTCDEHHAADAVIYHNMTWEGFVIANCCNFVFCSNQLAA